MTMPEEHICQRRARRCFLVCACELSAAGKGSWPVGGDVHGATSKNVLHSEGVGASCEQDCDRVLVAVSEGKVKRAKAVRIVRCNCRRALGQQQAHGGVFHICRGKLQRGVPAEEGRPVQHCADARADLSI